VVQNRVTLSCAPEGLPKIAQQFIAGRTRHEWLCPSSPSDKSLGYYQSPLRGLISHFLNHAIPAWFKIRCLTVTPSQIRHPPPLAPLCSSLPTSLPKIKSLTINILHRLSDPRPQRGRAGVGVKNGKIYAPFIPPPNLPPLEGGALYSALILQEKMWAMISPSVGEGETPWPICYPIVNHAQIPFFIPWPLKSKKIHSFLLPPSPFFATIAWFLLIHSPALAQGRVVWHVFPLNPAARDKTTRRP
jgi:hypothetical protein